MILYFLLFLQSYNLYLFPHLFGLFSLLRIRVCCIYISFFSSFALSGALFTVEELIPHLSLLIGVLDKFGAVLYFQEQEKSIGLRDLTFLTRRGRSRPVAASRSAAAFTWFRRADHQCWRRTSPSGSSTLPVRVQPASGSRPGGKRALRASRSPASVARSTTSCRLQPSSGSAQARNCMTPASRATLYCLLVY